MRHLQTARWVYCGVRLEVPDYTRLLKWTAGGKTCGLAAESGQYSHDEGGHSIQYASLGSPSTTYFPKEGQEKM